VTRSVVRKTRQWHSQRQRGASKPPKPLSEEAVGKQVEDVPVIPPLLDRQLSDGGRQLLRDQLTQAPILGIGGGSLLDMPKTFDPAAEPTRVVSCSSADAQRQSIRKPPLSMIAEQGSKSLFKLFISKLAKRHPPVGSPKFRAVLDQTDGHGWCPVIEAARFGHHEILGRLLELGANGQVAEGSGWTAMDWAAQYGHHECIRVLFWHLGPDHVRTHKGIGKALALTAAKGFHLCVRELRIHVEFVKDDLREATREASRWGNLTHNVREELDRPGTEYHGLRETLNREMRWRGRKWLVFAHHRHRRAFLEAHMRGSKAQVIADLSSLPPYLLRLVARFLV